MSKCKICKREKFCSRDLCTNAQCESHNTPVQLKSHAHSPISVFTPHGFHGIVANENTKYYLERISQ
jgi:hypothetical protein